MIGRLLRLARVALLLVTLTAVAILAGAWAALGTRTGSVWTLQQAAGQAGADLSYASFAGSLLHGFEIQDLDASLDDTSIHIQRLVLRWSASELLRSRLHVSEIGLHAVTLITPPEEEPTAEPSIAVPALPEVRLPLALEVTRVELSALRLGARDAAPVLERLTFGLGVHEDELTIDGLDLGAQGLGVAGTVGVRMLGDWPLEGSLRIVGSSAETPIDMRATVGGAIRAPSLELDVTAPMKADVIFAAELHQHPPVANLQASWQEAALAAAAPLVSRAGSIRASTRDMTLELHLDMALSDAPGDLRHVTVDAEAKLDSLLAPYPLKAEVGWQVQAGAQRFAGKGRIAGDALRMELDHALQTPFQVTTRGSVEPAGVNTRVDLAGDWQAMTWPPGDAAAPSSPAGSYSVRGALEAMALQVQASLERVSGVRNVTVNVAGGAAATAPHAFHGDIRWRADTQAAGEVTGAGSVHGDAGRITFEHDLSGPGRLRAAGTVALAPSLDVEVSGDFADLRWPLDGEPQASVRSGRFSVDGLLEALAVELDADADTAQVGSVRLRSRATVSPSEAQAIDLRADLLNGSVNVAGSVDWQEQLSATLTITARDLDPGRLHPQASGRVSAQVGVDLRVTDAGPRGTVDLRSLEGSLGGYPVEGTGRVALVEGGFAVRDLSLRTGENLLTLSGDVAQTLSLDYRLNAPDLSQLWPGLAGAVRGDGQVRGTTDAPRVQASLTARGLGAGDATLAGANLEADLDLSGRGQLSLRAEVDGIGAGGEPVVEQARVDLTGSLARHQLVVSANAKEGRVSASAAGGLEGGRWSGELRELSALATPIGDWRLASATPLSADATGAESGEACLASGEARLCVQAKRPGAGQQSVALSLSALPVKRFSPWLPPELDISGALDGSAAAKRSGDDPWEATATITATPIRLRLGDEAQGTPLQLSLDETRVEARHGAGGSRATVSSRIAGDGRVRGEVSLGPMAPSGTPLAGRVDASLPDLSPLAALLPALTGLAGRLDAGLDLAGSVQQPQVAGELRLQDARAAVPAAGITLERTALLMRADGNGAFTLSGEAHSGPGSIALAGEGRVSGSGYTANVTARGANFEAVKLLAMQALVSPDLRLEADPQRLRLTGSVGIPEATVSIKELPADVVKVSDDETIAGQERAPPPPWRETLEANVDITFGEKVHISAFGLDADLRGGLAVDVRGANPPTGRGAVTLEGGRFKAYGQDLQIRRGRLLFAGPLDNPGLDVRAVRDAGEVVAGIAVSGSANSMRSTIFSEPALPQAEALSWLLTGRGLSGSSSSQGASMAAAALALGVEGSDQITRQIASAVGLDEVAIDSSGSVEESSLLLGKTLAPGLYIRYVLGVLDQEGTVQVEYKITDRISLEVESGTTQQGADILYRLER